MSLNSYLLLDAALTGAVNTKQMFEAVGARFIYAPYGEAAELVGPVIFPLTTELSHTLLPKLSAPPAIYGRAELVCNSTLEVLCSHLFGLHELTTGQGKRFFLRYADARVFNNLWQVLNDSQKRQVLGPVVTWTVMNRRAESESYRSPNSTTSVPAETLHISREQFSRLRHLSAPDDLLAETFDIATHLKECGSEQQCWLWAKALCEQLNRLRIQHPATAIAACQHTLMTEGHALEDPGFLTALQQAQRDQNAQPVIAWQGLPAARIAVTPRER